MKNINKSILFLIFSSFLFVGCNSLLDVDSDQIVFENQYKLTGANDTLYSMSAILSQVQKLANSYVLLGELRGDLMDVSTKSSPYLHEINDFQISDSNPYANNIRDYYSIINNCNYVLHNIDTSVVNGGIKVMYREYAAAKGIRAWTYMQLVLNFGSAIYYDKPILSVSDAESVQTQVPLSLNELAPLLIADLSPWKDADMPNFGTIYNQNTRKSFFPIRFILGDLYLYTGQYENAANEYHDLIYNNKYTIGPFRTMYTVTNSVFTGGITYFNGGWEGEYLGRSNEDITYIAATNQYGRKFELDSLCYYHRLAPSPVAINNWYSQRYVQSVSLDTVGDLRSIGSLSVLNIGRAYYINKPFTTNDYIQKFVTMNPLDSTKNENKQIVVYRTPLLYLRYAEAVNRLGKSNLAFAVIKNGLNFATLSNNTIVPSSEKTPLSNYMDFTSNIFINNTGIRMRGCGNVNLDTTNYRIPNYALYAGPRNNPKQDSIEFVEDAIQTELALEMAFEGNRFHDLMRFAIRRNDPAYLADKVAAKHVNNKEAIREKLMHVENWYLKK
ncbi:MAG: RagB/SusD family nutrient uptake outer membrane protein [Paludibacter sp.]|nr:RagB/SusD family nutrient uptake outer membrane protein [Paludibacter sp.]